ncbi:MAG: thiamine phosphate synthase [Alphaproteobacteria bacterium]|nr:thiamine phosphate synthase [Alphaproteobacteria bacterium]
MPARYFLIAPKDLPASEVTACAAAACAAGDCASIVLHESARLEDVQALQALGLAVLIADVEPRIVSRLKADGLHLTHTEHNLLDLRMSLPKDAMVGLDCGTSRHQAMEAAEQGADYVGFRQKAQTGGEPLVKWWNDLAEIPAIPLDAATAAEATILAKQSDFIRPADEMWQNPAAATRVLTELNEKLK